MAEKKVKAKRWDGSEVEILGETYEEGLPERALDWRSKFQDRDQMLKYLKTGLRYWYSKDWYGSERRKNPA